MCIRDSCRPLQELRSWTSLSTASDCRTHCCSTNSFTWCSMKFWALDASRGITCGDFLPAEATTIFRERQAYSLGHRFEQRPREGFSVLEEVREWQASGRF